MRNFKCFFTVCCLSFLFNSFAQSQPDTSGPLKGARRDDDRFTLLTSGDETLSNLKKLIYDARHNLNEKHIPTDTLIKDKGTAINVAEAMLFNLYGKNNIIKQRPYQVEY